MEVDVRFPEVDSYGVVWHGHYVLYFEIVRDALCTAGGFSPSQGLALGYKVPITRFEAQVKRPALLDDRLELSCVLRPPETAKLEMEYEVRRAATRELLATGFTQQVFLNPQGELMLTFPMQVRGLVERVLAFHRGEAELTRG